MNNPDATAALKRTADRTRRAILDAAFRQIYRCGYQGTRLDDILDTIGLTKGALYHHFPNKQALGYAVVDEVIRAVIQAVWLRPLAEADEPLEQILRSIRDIDTVFGSDIVTFGCPLNNLAQEMSPLDEGFRTRLDRIYQEWHQGIRDALQRAQQTGHIRADVDCANTASFVLAALAGCIGVAKNAQSLDQLQVCGAGLIDYLESLRTVSR
ncbi:MAG: TetR/AcrR family transcriptional regulator [Thiohalobacteraceae bacterium]|nr:TetR/AcrR family transcriptional regulator [Gammaproteobacteria bacterium]